MGDESYFADDDSLGKCEKVFTIILYLLAHKLKKILPH